ncbi:ATP-binding protein [Desulfobacterales bacterium HSG2]|nr:ATP-binding protein [Desulfobacterales bacterium HSG2]
MKIKAIHVRNVGPLNRSLDFQDEWRGDVHDHILLSGPNGSGKTIVLQAVSILWETVGYWLDNRKMPNRNNPVQKWLRQWQCIAMVLRECPHSDAPVVIFSGNAESYNELRSKYENHKWIGEIVCGETKSKRKSMIPRGEWIDLWAEARKKMILTFDKSDTPNVIWLDAEQRRWVTPRRNLGQTLPEDSKLRWLVTYQATEDWQSQLESSLINLKYTKLHKYHKVIRDLNDFLCDKEIDPNVRPGENRLQVILKNRRGKAHAIDDLSAGEHQIMIQLYTVSRWMEEGGIVLIDEPDLFLHPSLIPGFLSKLESLVKERNGQMIITSHNPDVWKRYERKGLRVSLGGEH